MTCGIVRAYQVGHLVTLSRNLYVNTGYAQWARFLAGQAPAFPTTVQFGTGVVAATAADTALGAWVYTALIEQASPAGASVVYICYAPKRTTPPYTFTELGLFAGGVMFARTLVTIDNMDTQSTCVTWTIDLAT